MRVAAPAMASNTNVRLTIDLTGANGDETIRAIAYDAAARGFAAARAASSSDFQRKVRNTIP